MEQSGLEPGAMWNAGAAGRSSTCSTMVLVDIFSDFSIFSQVCLLSGVVYSSEVSLAHQWSVSDRREVSFNAIQPVMHLAFAEGPCGVQECLYQAVWFMALPSLFLCTYPELPCHWKGEQRAFPGLF